MAKAAQDAVRGDQRTNAFVDQQAPRKSERDGAFGFRQRLQGLGIDAGAWNQGHPGRLDAERQQGRAIVRIWTSTTLFFRLSSQGNSHTMPPRNSRVRQFADVKI